MTITLEKRLLLTATILTAALCTGCGLPGPLPDHDERVKRAYIFYLDGAGGGTAVRNWALGLRQGLLDAGYRGSGEMFNWETGAGIGADQAASVQYKRGKGRELARKIIDFKKQHPGAPVHIIALSAGTAVAAYALEALPAGENVDTVIYFGASISASYDMTTALGHITNKLYIFTSEKDAVLSIAIPAAGTADRESGRPAGLTGFTMPAKATAETRALYRQKIETIPWRSEFWWYGNGGGHTDGVTSRFVKQFVAPLITQRGYASGT